MVPRIETPGAVNHLFVGKQLLGGHKNRFIAEGPRIAQIYPKSKFAGPRHTPMGVTKISALISGSPKRLPKLSETSKENSRMSNSSKGVNVDVKEAAKEDGTKNNTEDEHKKNSIIDSKEGNQTVVENKEFITTETIPSANGQIESLKLDPTVNKQKSKNVETKIEPCEIETSLQNLPNSLLVNDLNVEEKDISNSDSNIFNTILQSPCNDDGSVGDSKANEEEHVKISECVDESNSGSLQENCSTQLSCDVYVENGGSTVVTTEEERTTSPDPDSGVVISPFSLSTSEQETVELRGEVQLNEQTSPKFDLKLYDSKIDDAVSDTSENSNFSPVHESTTPEHENSPISECLESRILDHSPVHEHSVSLGSPMLDKEIKLNSPLFDLETNPLPVQVMSDDLNSNEISHVQNFPIRTNSMGQNHPIRTNSVGQPSEIDVRNRIATIVSSQKRDQRKNDSCKKSSSIFQNGAMDQCNSTVSPTSSLKHFNPFPVHHVNQNRAKTGVKLGLYKQSALKR